MFSSSKSRKSHSKTLKRIEKLVLAIETDNVERVREVLSKLAPGNYTDRQGRPLLELACVNGYLEIAKLLIQHSAFVDYNESAPIIAAIENGHEKVVKFLLRSRANPNAKVTLPTINQVGFLIHFAVAKGTVAILQMLLDHGCQIEQATETGLRPIHVAAMFGKLDMITELCNSGADPNVQEQVELRTPLHLAVANKKYGAIEQLLKLPVDTNITDGKQMTPLRLAEYLGQRNFVNLMQRMQNEKEFTSNMQTLATNQVRHSSRLSKVEADLIQLPNQLKADVKRDISGEIRIEVARQIEYYVQEHSPQRNNGRKFSHHSSGFGSMDVLSEQSSSSPQHQMSHSYSVNSILNPHHQPVEHPTESLLKKEYRDLLVSKFALLLNNMRSHDVIPEMYSRRMFTSSDKEHVDALKQERDKNNFILRCISRGDNRMYTTFVQILRDTNQGHLANELNLSVTNQPGGDFGTEYRAPAVSRSKSLPRLNFGASGYAVVHEKSSSVPAASADFTVPF